MKTIELDDGTTVQVEVRPQSELKEDIEKPQSALGKKRNFEKKPTKPKRPPIPKLFQPEGKPDFVKMVPEDAKGVTYHTGKLKLKRSLQRRKRNIVMDKLAPPTTIPNTTRSKAMLWLV